MDDLKLLGRSEDNFGEWNKNCENSFMLSSR